LERASGDGPPPLVALRLSVRLRGFGAIPAVDHEIRSNLSLNLVRHRPRAADPPWMKKTNSLDPSRQVLYPRTSPGSVEQFRKRRPGGLQIEARYRLWDDFFSLFVECTKAFAPAARSIHERRHRAACPE
jgi:hypothetical protein